MTYPPWLESDEDEEAGGVCAGAGGRPPADPSRTSIDIDSILRAKSSIDSIILVCDLR